VTTSFLDDMVSRRTARISAEYGRLSPADRERLACCARPVRDFSAALRDRADVAVIAEVKKASPSAGPIAPDCEAGKQALHYQAGGAAAISVLTEPESFGGSFADLSDVADAVDLPVLAKDFVVDPVQLFVARGHGADAVLLMVSVLGPKTAEFVDIAETLGLTPVVEVVNPQELEVALRAGARVVAVNNRDLHTLVVDAGAARATVAQAAQAGVIVIVASGTKTRDDVAAAAAASANAVLVGEALMRQAFPEDLLEELTGVARTPVTE
jgi:indole-3-glycerol phosphate synthase